MMLKCVDCDPSNYPLNIEVIPIEIVHQSATVEINVQSIGKLLSLQDMTSEVRQATRGPSGYRYEHEVPIEIRLCDLDIKLCKLNCIGLH